MLKPLTFSVSLAVALGTCSLGMAGHGKALPTPQCEGPSAQCPTPQCGDICGPVGKKCHLFDLFKHKPKCVEYEWVLKKKRQHPFKGLFHRKPCAEVCCEVVTPSPQWPTPQAGAWPAPQAGGSGQAPPTAGGDTAGPAPEPPPAGGTASNSLLYLAPAGN
jgi:hypothetical protein